MLRARLSLSCVLVSCSCVHIPLFMGVLCFPFYKRRESVGYREVKEEERERRRVPGLLAPSSPLYGARRSCRCCLHQNLVGQEISLARNDTRCITCVPEREGNILWYIWRCMTSRSSSSARKYYILGEA